MIFRDGRMDGIAVRELDEGSVLVIESERNRGKLVSIGFLYWVK